MFAFDWREVASEALVTRVCAAVGMVSPDNTPVIRNLLARVLELAGGHPYTDRQLSDGAFEKIASGLLDDALREAFVDQIRTPGTRGYVLVNPAGDNFDQEIELQDLIQVNWCGREELEALPVIGDVLADRIIAERQLNGAFRDVHDLASRVSGLGERSVLSIAACLRFDQSPTAIPVTECLDDLIAYLVAGTGEQPEVGLQRVLEYTISQLAAGTGGRWFADRDHDGEMPEVPYQCASLSVLKGDEYYSWLNAALGNASDSITMAMFHAAMPSNDHPTRQLVSQLVSASQRGLSVRVLLDDDRKEDPYKSRIINTPVFEALQEGGVQVKFDNPDRLLHSKYLILDDALVVLGSHNWSAGSYFKYDDVSLVMKSDELARELRQRFDVLWSEN